jgi:DNA-binding transcriptional LysR family regulator
VRCLLTVVDEGHFGRAAERLFVSSPALSQQVRKLERVVGTTLIDRSVHPLRLTPAGEVFLVEAREALAASERALAAVAAHRRQQEATLRVGFMTASAGPRLRQMIATVKASVPGVAVQLVGLSWPQQAAAVRDGSCDASLVRPPIEDVTGLRFDLVEWETRVVALPIDHWLAARADVSVSDLDGEVHATDSHSDPVWVRWWACDPRPSGIPVRYGPEAHTMDELLEIVAAGQAIAITGSFVPESYRRPDVVFVPITDAAPCPLSLCTRAGDSSALVQLLRRATRTTHPEVMVTGGATASAPDAVRRRIDDMP